METDKCEGNAILPKDDEIMSQNGKFNLPGLPQFKRPHGLVFSPSAPCPDDLLGTLFKVETLVRWRFVRIWRTRYQINLT